MRRLWKSIILPLFNELKPKYIIEIGSEEGINTEKILNYCIENHANLTTIDPMPLFDENLFKNQFGNHFELIKDLSLNCLDNFDDYDMVLIDGDHNWYTVYNELKLIEKKFYNKRFPVVILHDIGWPYGRRDLYYNPNNIPEEYLNPYDKRGIVPDKNDLLETGGMNSNLNNALFENTEKNGVLTAVEDFLKESYSDLLFSKVMGFFGLGIIYPNDNEIKFVVEKVISNSDITSNVEKFYLKETVMFLNKISELNKSITLNNNKINELNNVNSELMDVNSSLSKDNNNLVDENNKLTIDVSNLINSKKILSNEINNLTIENKKLDDINQELVTSNRYLLSKNKKLIYKLDNYNDLLDENEKLVARNKALSNSKFRLFEENKKLNVEKLVIANDNFNLINENKRLSDIINKSFASILQYKIEKDNQQIVINNLVLENKRLKDSFYFKLLNKFKIIIIKFKNKITK